MAKLGGKVQVLGLAGACVALVVSAASCSSDDDGAEPLISAGTGGSAAQGGDGNDTPEGGSSSGGSKVDGGTSGRGGSAPVAHGGEGGQSTPPGAGGEGGARPDPLGAGGWESVQGDPPIDASCGDYVESADRSNSGYGEVTGLDVDSFAVTICGRFDAYHFSPPSTDEQALGGIVDEDGFVLDVANGDYQVALEVLGDDAPDSIGLNVSPGYSDGGSARVVGDHAAVWTQGSSKTLPIYVSARNPSALAHSVAYKLHVRRDSPRTRCTPIGNGVPAQKYVESKDGAKSEGNDVIRWEFLKSPQVPTTSTADAPEATGIVLKGGDRSLIQGTSALVDHGEDYADSDMFAFKTGSSGVLTVRLDWAGNKTDLDVMLLKENQYDYIAASASYDTVAPEQFTLQVEPQTNYWLYVSGASESGAAGLPMTYSATLCGEDFEL